MRPGSSECLGPTGRKDVVPQPPLQMPLRPDGRAQVSSCLAHLWFSLPSRDIILESIPTDNPGAHSNLYILTGHQSSY